MPESGTSGSVRDRDGQPPGLLDLQRYRKAIGLTRKETQHEHRKARITLRWQ